MILRHSQTDVSERQMKITVFGATGGVGTQLVQQGVQRGHAVTAVVRDAARLTVRDPALRICTVAGLDDPGILAPAIGGSDAVLSAVGPRGRKDGPVASTSTRAVLSAMDTCAVDRFIAVSAMPVGPVPQGESVVTRWLLRPTLKALLHDAYADLAEMEAQLQRSGIAWTVVRPPKLVNEPLTGQYRMALGANVPRGSTISRADVAHAMLDALQQPQTIRQAVGLAY
jgi:putative NADH-flavin reductase